jgi:CubicO group peptidase (beta-lactamase class C family)
MLTHQSIIWGDSALSGAQMLSYDSLYNCRVLFRLRSAWLAFCVLPVVTIVSFTGVYSYPQAVDTKQIFAREDAYIAEETVTHHFRGTVLVGIDGKIVFEKAYGPADQEWDVPNTPKAKFRIASLTKQFTAACVLILQERGLLHVQEPISKYLGDVPPAWKRVTIHQLLTHTAGLPNPDYSGKQYANIQRTGAVPKDLVALVGNQPLDFMPGTKWNYSNTGYILLGILVEKLSGQSYAEFLRSNIFQPLGMNDSGYDRETDILNGRASGYQIKDGHLANADFIDMSTPFSAGGIYSTVEDMFRWNEALAHPGKLLSADSLNQMFTEYPEAVHQGQHYGYGVVISRQKFGKLLYYHGGGVEGFSSSIQRYPEEGLCIVVLSNLATYNPWELGDHIAADIFHLPMPTAH